MNVDDVQQLDRDPDSLAQAASLLADSVSPQVRGWVPYGAPKFVHYLRQLVALPDAYRTLFARVYVRHHEVLGVADWRCIANGLLLNGIAVREGQRGQGLGSALINDGFRLAQRLSRPALILDVDQENVAAYRFYRRYGFYPVGESQWFPPVEGASHVDGVRIANAAEFLAQHNAYGFGTLTAITGEGEALIRIVQRKAIVAHQEDLSIGLAASHALFPRSVGRVVAPDQLVGSGADIEHAGPVLVRLEAAAYPSSGRLVV